jgi:hypothetical protein
VTHNETHTHAHAYTPGQACALLSEGKLVMHMCLCICVCVCTQALTCLSFHHASRHTGGVNSQPCSVAQPRSSGADVLPLPSSWHRPPSSPRSSPQPSCRLEQGRARLPTVKSKCISAHVLSCLLLMLDPVQLQTLLHVGRLRFAAAPSTRASSVPLCWSTPSRLSACCL